MAPNDDDGLIWEAQPAGLRRPVLVAAFEGWNDAADAATFATQWLTQHGDGTSAPRTSTPRPTSTSNPAGRKCSWSTA